MTRFSIPELLSKKECQALIAAAELQGFQAMGEHYPVGYRNNDRLVRDDAELAQWLWQRLRSHLPLLDCEKPIGLNSRFRFCRYRNGQSFTVHRDGAWAKSSTERTRLTVQVYLNDEFVGGETRFTEEGVSIRPVTGTCIVFDHRLWHDGAPVSAGTKYVLRTDVVYPVRDRPSPAPVGEGALREVARFEGHQGYVWQAIVRRDGTIVSGSRDGTVRQWPSGEVLRRETGSVIALAEGKDGELIVGTREAGTLSLTPLHDGRVLQTHTDGSISLDGRRLSLGGGWCWSATELSPGHIVAASEDGLIRNIDLTRWTSSHYAQVPNAARAVTRLHDGSVLIGLADGQLWVDGQSHKAHASAVTGVVEVRPGLWASASEDGTVALWNHKLGRIVGVGRHDDFVRSVACTGQKLITASYDGTVREWSIDL